MGNLFQLHRPHQICLPHEYCHYCHYYIIIQRICLLICLLIYLFICLFVCLLICLFIYFVYLFIYLFICLFVCLFTYLFVCLLNISYLFIGIAMGQVGIHLNLVSGIFSGTNFTTFNGGVFIVVPNVIINLEVETAFASDFIGVGAYLDRFSQVNHDGFCLAVKFTHRDFDNGVLGLAYVGKTQFGSGGICDPFTGTKGLNTGEFLMELMMSYSLKLFRYRHQSQLRQDGLSSDHFSDMGPRDGTQLWV